MLTMMEVRVLIEFYHLKMTQMGVLEVKTIYFLPKSRENIIFPQALFLLKSFKKNELLFHLYY